MKLANAIVLTFPEDTVVSITQNPITVNEFSLKQNYPNPFNPTTTIEYTIAPANYSSGETSVVKLKIYDVLGNEIAILVDKEKPAGKYRVEFNASGLPSGIYFYQLNTGNYTETKKMILIK